MLDVSAWARDAIALALPEKILCRPDCAGLCGVCGKNLNDEPHEHEEHTAIRAGPRSKRCGRRLRGQSSIRPRHLDPPQQAAVMRHHHEPAFGTLSAVSSSSIASRSLSARRASPPRRAPRGTRTPARVRSPGERDPQCYRLMLSARRVRTWCPRLSTFPQAGVNFISLSNTPEQQVAPLVQLAQTPFLCHPARAAARERQLAGERADQRRLARAVRADDREAIAEPEVEVDRPQAEIRHQEVGVLLVSRPAGRQRRATIATSPAPRLAATAEALPPPGTGSADASAPTKLSSFRSRKRADPVVGTGRL